jgi:hypothetical protein
MSVPTHLASTLILTDPAEVPADRDQIPGDALITNAVWAHFQGVSLEGTFYAQLTKSRRNRRHDAAHPEEPKWERPGDIPEADGKIGKTPVWYMQTYRDWDKRRPGQASSIGKGGGTGSRGGEGARKQVRLPIECPHCHHKITATDLGYSSAREPLRTAERAAVTAGTGSKPGKQRRRAIEG